MKALVEYLIEGKSSLNSREKEIKELTDMFFKEVLKETYYVPDWKNSLDNLPEKMLKEDFQFFKYYLRWMPKQFPEDIYEFTAKYFLRRLMIKGRVKLPTDESFFDNLYNSWKEDIIKAFKEDNEEKRRLISDERYNDCPCIKTLSEEF